MLFSLFKKAKEYFKKNMDYYEANKNKASQVGLQIADSFDKTRQFYEKNRGESLENKLLGLSRFVDKNSSLLSSMTSTIDNLVDSKPGFLAGALLFNKAISSYCEQKVVLREEKHTKKTYNGNYTTNINTYIKNYSSISSSEEDKYFSKIARVLSGNYIGDKGNKKSRARWDDRLLELDKLLLNAPEQISSDYDKKINELIHIIKNSSYLKRTKKSVQDSVLLKLDLLKNNYETTTKLVTNNCYAPA